MTAVHDILHIADLRSAGDSARDLANRLETEAEGGYRVAVIPLTSDRADFDGPAWAEPLANLVRKSAVDWIDAESAGVARLIVVDGLALLRWPWNRTPRSALAGAVVLVGADPRDGNFLASNTWDRVRANANVALGPSVRWIATDPDLRERLIERLGADAVEAEPWPPVLDLRSVIAEGLGPRGTRPIIGTVLPSGKGAPPLVLKKPPACLPVCARFAVHLLGEMNGGGAVPANWRFVAPEEGTVTVFMGGVDFFCPLPGAKLDEKNRDLVRAAMAAGAVPLLPPEWWEHFGDAAVYCAPHDVASIVSEIYIDTAALVEARERAVAHVDRREGPRAHIERVRALLGAPAEVPSLIRVSDVRPERTVLFMSTNGIGLGHLTRLLAVARHLPAGLRPVFFSLSHAIDVVRDAGYDVEFCLPHDYGPYVEHYRAGGPHWEESLRRQLNQVIAYFDVRGVLFDGNVPYLGLVACRRDNPHIPFLWCRRAMWRPDTKHRYIERGTAFDLVIEPGEVAASMNGGMTRDFATRRCTVDPVMLLDADEVPERDRARVELGLSLDTTAVALLLGSRNNYDYGAVARRAVSFLETRDDVEIVAFDWLIADEEGSDLPAFVRRVTGFPFARHLKAFDLAISAVGYNSFHELIALEVPTLFVPNENPRMDDQWGRALFAERRHMGRCLRASEMDRLPRILDEMLDADTRAAMRAACRAHVFPNGAAEVAAIVEEAIYSMFALLGADWCGRPIEKTSDG
jgi:hypothetical protein